MRNQNFNRFLFLVIFMSPWLAFISWCNSVLPREIKLCISLCHAFDDVVKKKTTEYRGNTVYRIFWVSLLFAIFQIPPSASFSCLSFLNFIHPNFQLFLHVKIHCFMTLYSFRHYRLENWLMKSETLFKEDLFSVSDWTELLRIIQ